MLPTAKEGEKTRRRSHPGLLAALLQSLAHREPILRSLLQNSTNVQSLLQEVNTLGHYPKRYKHPADKTERASDSLAKKLAKVPSVLQDKVNAVSAGCSEFSGVFTKILSLKKTSSGSS